MNKEIILYPEFITFSNNNNNVQMMNTTYANANFYRNDMNTNIEINIPMGSFSSGLYISNNTYMPTNIFNSLIGNNSVTFINNASAKVLINSYIMHDIYIRYKLTKSDGSNYINQRNINATLVKQDGITTYNSSVVSNTQPNTGEHDTIIIKGMTTNSIDDILKLKFAIYQDTYLDGNSDTKLTIFGMTWVIASTASE